MTPTPDDADRPEGDEIRLRLPALVLYGRVSRLAVTGLASRNGFAYEEVEDLRIAVGEVFGVLVEPESADAQLQFTCSLPGDAIVVDVVRLPPAPIAEVTDLTRQILAAVVDQVEIDEAIGQVTITKRTKG